MDLQLIEIAFAAFAGGVIAALLGWASRNPAEPFDVKRIVYSALTALISGIVYAATLYTPSGNFTRDLLIALVFVGTGGDVVVERGIGAIKAKIS
jgi:hypothetical protein